MSLVGSLGGFQTNPELCNSNSNSTKLPQAYSHAAPRVLAYARLSARPGGTTMNTSGLHVCAGSRRWQQAAEGAEVWAVHWDDLLAEVLLCGYAAYCACELAKQDL